MDLRQLYKEVSNKLRSDFGIASQFNHNGNIGDYRENALRTFLEPRLPGKFGVGTGEIIGFGDSVSKQSDLIIYDKLESVPLHFDDSVQAYPLGGVYGITEVKSKLSVTKLLEGLENIKSVKGLVPNERVERRDGMMVQFFPRPKPFGCIFAYSLSGNSLKSLVQNLRDWEDKNKPEFWPNMVVVLNEGIIVHHEASGGLQLHEMHPNCTPFFHEYKEDTLFQFYANILTLCEKIRLPSFELSKHRYPEQTIAGLPVRSRDILVKKNEFEYAIYNLTDARLAEILIDAGTRGVFSKQSLAARFNINIDLRPNLNDDQQFLIYDPKGKFLNEAHLSKVIVDTKVWHSSFAKITIAGRIPVYLPYISLEDV